MQSLYFHYDLEFYHLRYWLDEDGLLHREDGPAVEWNDGYKAWWLNGKHITEKEYNARA